VVVKEDKYDIFLNFMYAIVWQSRPD